MSLTISEVMTRIPSAFLAEKAAGVNAVVHFRFTGAEAGEWNAVIHDGRCEVAQGLPRSRPTISVVSDSGDFLKVASGELDGMKAFMDGKLKITGDLLLAPKLIQLFRVS
ncbi:MAG TPA: SCP2 sterol-binding domain-containing protein [Anaerolineales bacterium]